MNYICGMKGLHFLLAFCFFSANAQTDSLEVVYARCENDTTRINLINRIVYAFEQTNLDSAARWAQQGFSISQKTGNNKGVGYYYNHKGRLNLYTQKYDSA